MNLKENCDTCLMLKCQKVSGRKDLNLRPLGPEPSALAGLSHAPNCSHYTLAVTIPAREKGSSRFTVKILFQQRWPEPR